MQKQFHPTEKPLPFYGKRSSRGLGRNVPALCYPNKSTTDFVECTSIGIFTVVCTDTYAHHFLRLQEKSYKFFVLPFFPHLLCCHQYREN